MLIKLMGALDFLVGVFATLYYFELVGYIPLIGFVLYLGLKAFAFRDFLSILDGLVGVCLLVFIITRWDFLLIGIIAYFVYKLVVSLM